MFEDELFFTPEANRTPLAFPGDNEGCEALQVAELVMATLFKRRYAHLHTEPVQPDARHLQESLRQALAA